MTITQIKNYLQAELERNQFRADLLEKLTQAVVDCQNHVKPSGRIANAFAVRYAADGFKCYWKNGNDDKHDWSELYATSPLLKLEDRIEIHAYPKDMTFAKLYEELRHYKFAEQIGKIKLDLGRVGEYYDWDAMVRQSMKELLTTQPFEPNWPMSQCFAKFEVPDAPDKPR